MKLFIAKRTNSATFLTDPKEQIKINHFIVVADQVMSIYLYKNQIRERSRVNFLLFKIIVILYTHTLLKYYYVVFFFIAIIIKKTSKGWNLLFPNKV